MFSEKYIFEQTPGILVKFCHPSDLRLWRTGMLLLTKTKGHMSNVHYSGFPKHLQTKSNLHISISQNKLKHKCLPLDTQFLQPIIVHIFLKNKGGDFEILDFRTLKQTFTNRRQHLKRVCRKYSNPLRYGIYTRILSSQCQLSALLNLFKLVYQSFGQIKTLPLRSISVQTK